MLMVGINGIFLAEMLDRWYLPLISVFAFVAANVFPSVAKGGYPSFKFRMIAHGSELLLQFLITTLLSSVIYIQSAFQMLPDNWVKWALCLACGVYTVLERYYFRLLYIGSTWHKA